ncbi:hypothetical protein, partial [Bacillus sp. SJS]|uniref:hypothetical protein n=1 Tax=Bacillus sp. SJS TaxID=1423321 RepID=UPI000556AEDA
MKWPESKQVRPGNEKERLEKRVWLERWRNRLESGEVAGKQVSPAGKREGTAGKKSLADSSFVRQNRQTKRPSCRLSDKIVRQSG